VRTAIAVAAVLLAALGMVASASPSVAQTTDSCQVSGTTNLGSSSYTLSANLSNCVSSTARAPAEGKLGQGQSYTESVSITTSTGAVVQGTAQYQQSPGSGNACPGNSSPVTGSGFGDWIVSWSDGTNTVLNTVYTVANQTIVKWGGVSPGGGNPSVESGTTLNLVAGSENPAGTAPSTFAITSNNPAFPPGTPTSAQLTLAPSDPTSCSTNGSEGNAALSGLLALGLDTSGYGTP